MAIYANLGNQQMEKNLNLQADSSDINNYLWPSTDYYSLSTRQINSRITAAYCLSAQKKNWEALVCLDNRTLILNVARTVLAGFCPHKYNFVYARYSFPHYPTHEFKKMIKTPHQTTLQSGEIRISQRFTWNNLQDTADKLPRGINIHNNAHCWKEIYKLFWNDIWDCMCLT